ncbi:MAG: hypothetical protein H5T49_05870 [Hadesarchaea archaeon]|nr:hypothetical protein [Hadesarchaea archaeon]
MKKRFAVIAAALAVAIMAVGAAVWSSTQTAPQFEEPELPKEYPSSAVKNFLKYALVGDYEGASRYLYDKEKMSGLLHFFDEFVGKDIRVKIINQSIKEQSAVVVFAFYKDNTQISKTLCGLDVKDSEWRITIFDRIPEAFW